MADVSIVLPGTGTNVDTRTVAGGDHRQVLVIGDPANNAGVAPVDAVNGLTVSMSPTSPGVIATGTPGVAATTHVISVQGVTSMTPVAVSGAVTVSGTVAVSGTVPVSGSVSVSALTAAASGLTTSRLNSAASTNATAVKTSAGNIAELDVYNTNTYTVYLKFYNKASTPTVGTDTPVWTIPVAPGGGYSKSFSRGRSFSLGIALAITKLQADSDVTAVLAGDLTGSIEWV
jgi:hypothetical protein